MSDPSGGASNLAIYDIAAEQAVLGSMLIDAACVRSVLPKLREQDFSMERNRAIWSAIQTMDLSGTPIDALTVAEQLRADSEMRAYIAELMEVTPTSANVLEYAEIVAGTSKRRRLREALRDATSSIDERKPDDEVFPHIEAAIEAYDDRSREGILSPIEQNDEFFAHRKGIDGGTPPFTQTGFPSLDDMLGGGLLNGNLFFLAARPGTGKTAFAINMAENIAANVGPVLFASMEMSAAEIMSRRLAMKTHIDSQRLLMKQLTEAEYNAVAAASIELGKSPLRLIAEGALSIERVSSMSRACKGICCLVIDHFTLFLRPHRQQDFSEYAELSHRLKNLARQLNIPIFCLIQVSRDNDTGKKKRSRLDSLRGSGATEEDAAGVLFIENVGDVSGTDGQPREEKIILEKYRYGPTGEITMSYRPRYNQFAEVVDEKAVMRHYAAIGKEVKERNRQEALKAMNARELDKKDEEGMPF